MNVDLLKRLAYSAKGDFYFVDNYSGLKSKIEKIISSESKDKVSVSEVNLWSNKWIMIIIICLFAIEWFIRKRAGML